jgi:AMMECR1 domain-containing protein
MVNVPIIPDMQVGKHGMILEFVDPSNYKRSATYLPEVAEHEGEPYFCVAA